MRRLEAVFAILLCAPAISRSAADTPALAHGLWVWGTLTALQAPGSARTLRNFCQAQGIADIPGARRDKLLEQVRGILRFNQSHPTSPFDGIRLDIEPQQRRENQGPDNLQFLPALVDAYHAVRSLAEPAGLMVGADIPRKFLEGDPGQRELLLSAPPRFTLMLYALSSPDDGKSAEAKAEKLRAASARCLAMDYQDLNPSNLAKLSIGPRTPDYGDQLARMLQLLDEANRNNPHYGGWARHSYNDYLKAQPQ